ncbi:MAG: haloacid dehalogenase type II [Alphaproteobacteria bacterium]|nr:haloacid dehalogenase type II [Alphaproteobacteria bacterium]
MTRAIEAVAFDAYGTLFDVHSVGALAEAMFAGQGARLSAAWRVAQIDYTRLRTLSDRYEDFLKVTEDALVFASKTLGLDLDADRRARLMAQYDCLSAYPENVAVLGSLRRMGLKLAILSNGTPAMLDAVLANAGMQGLFDHVLSVDAIRRYKTAREAYDLGPAAFGYPPARIVFVSSNGWDVCGATWYGYRTFWVNRPGNALEELGVRPAGEGRDLNDLLAFVGS